MTPLIVLSTSRKGIYANCTITEGRFPLFICVLAVGILASIHHVLILPVGPRCATSWTESGSLRIPCPVNTYSAVSECASLQNCQLGHEVSLVPGICPENCHNNAFLPANQAQRHAELQKFAVYDVKFNDFFGNGVVIAFVLAVVLIKVKNLTIMLLLAAIVLGTASPVTAQTSLQPVAWRLLSGSTTVDLKGVCGNAGSFMSSYAPGSRRYASVCIDPDTSDIYLFGGRGYHTAGQSTALGDIWMHKQSSWNDRGVWAWLGGSSNSGAYVGQYSGGTEYPGTRQEAISWFGAPNKVFIFAGYGHDNSVASRRLNDMWTFDTVALTWSWIKGSMTGNAVSVYGTKGIAAPASNPGGVYSAPLLTTASTEAVFFGGNGYDSSTTSGHLSVTWRYNASGNTWTWINGPALRGQSSQGGASSVFAGSYYPGGRYSCSAMNRCSIVYLFGGLGFSSTGAEGYLADVWAYNIASNQWAYICGESSGVDSAAQGSYGTMGVFASSNHPGSRYYLAPGWADPHSDLLHMFAGYGYSTTASNYLNDFWSFNATSKMWAWSGGSSNAPGDSVKNPDSSWSVRNIPGKRCSHASVTSDKLGLMYTVTGADGSYMNGLWATRGPAFVPTAMPTPTPTVSSQWTPSTAYYAGIVVSVLIFVTTMLLKIGDSMQHTVKSDQWISESLLVIVDALQFIAISSQLAIPIADAYRDFAGAFGWVLPVMRAPFDFVPQPSVPTSRRLLSTSTQQPTVSPSLSSVYGIDVKRIAMNYMPSLLFWAVIVLCVMIVYLFFIEKILRRFIRMQETGKTKADVSHWARIFGFFLRLLILTYYAICLATFYALSYSLPSGAGVFAVALLVLLAICLGIPLGWIGVLRKVPKTEYETRKFTTMFSSLSGGLKDTQYLFRVLMLGEKFFSALFVAVIVNGLAQVLLLLAAHIALFIALLVMKPHESPTMRKLMLVYVSIQLLDLFVLFILSFVESGPGQTGVSVTLLVLNILGMCSLLLICMRTIGIDRFCAKKADDSPMDEKSSSSGLSQRV